ncbi:hypothetical protein HJV72_10230 [Extibacter sp. GGCC_0201]|nr:hypothetical protein [Extibacter sp. GGCC_0201]
MAEKYTTAVFPEPPCSVCPASDSPCASVAAVELTVWPAFSDFSEVLSAAALLHPVNTKKAAMFLYNIAILFHKSILSRNSYGFAALFTTGSMLRQLFPEIIFNFIHTLHLRQIIVFID